VVYVQPRTNGKAVASLVLGIVWFWGITSILAIVFGSMARREIEESGGTQDGRGLAIAGIVLGWVGVGLLVVVVVVIALAITAVTHLSPVPSPTPTFV